MKTVVCPQCRKSFPVKPSHAHKRVYCNRACLAAAYATRLKGANNPHWQGGDGQKACEHCGAAFVVKRAKLSSARYCSMKCQNKARRIPKPVKVKKEKAPRLCKQCGQEGLEPGKVLHSECKRRRVSVACVDCGAMRLVSIDRPYQRCNPCSLKRRGGAFNGRWQGGITSENAALRRSQEYKAWRTAVLQRDGYTCVLCGKRGGELHADHIKPFAKYPKLRFDVSNGRTLCRPCHEKTPTYLSNRGQIDLFPFGTEFEHPVLTALKEVPDILPIAPMVDSNRVAFGVIVATNRGCIGLHLKSPKERVTQAQKRFIQRWHAAGQAYAVVASAEEARDVVIAFVRGEVRS